MRSPQIYMASSLRLSSPVQAIEDSANTQIFSKIANYAFGAHERMHKRQKLAARQRIVPAALAISGSINPADHAHTFPMLLQMLREKASL